MKKYEILEQDLRRFTENETISFPDLLPEAVKNEVLASSEQRDLFRTHPTISRFITHKNFGDLLNQLINRKLPIRLLMDKRNVQTSPIDINHFSFQGVMMGVLFDLKKNEATFFNPDSHPELPEEHFLVLYGEKNAQYVSYDEDPERNLLKKMGYTTGDTLHNEQFPIVYM